MPSDSDMETAKGDQETLDLYGCDPDEPSFARACLLARGSLIGQFS